MCLKAEARLWLLVCQTAYGTAIRELNTNVNPSEHPDQCPLVEAVSDSDLAFVPAESDSYHSGKRDSHPLIRIVCLTDNRRAYSSN